MLESISGSRPDEAEEQAGLHQPIALKLRMQPNNQGAGLDPPGIEKDSLRDLFFCLDMALEFLVQIEANFVRFGLNVVFEHLSDKLFPGVSAVCGFHAGAICRAANVFAS